jgi:hypothetical protein
MEIGSGFTGLKDEQDLGGGAELVGDKMGQSKKEGRENTNLLSLLFPFFFWGQSNRADPYFPPKSCSSFYPVNPDPISISFCVRRLLQIFLQKILDFCFGVRYLTHR